MDAPRTLMMTIGLCAAAAVSAGPEDCYNPGEPALLAAEAPEILRVTDADLEALVSALRAHEQRALAGAGPLGGSEGPPG